MIERGERLTSVGCDRGENPTALATRVTNVDRYQGPPNIEASGAPVEGRSGGGLFNSAGQLVGVCFAADYEGNEGLYTALESIHDELDRLNLSDIYRKADGRRTLGTGRHSDDGDTADRPRPGADAARHASDGRRSEWCRCRSPRRIRISRCSSRQD